MTISRGAPMAAGSPFGAALHPTQSVALHPTTSAALHPTTSAALHPTTGAALHPTTSAAPAGGVAANAMLADALRSTRAALVRSGDPLATPDAPRLGLPNEQLLWRWEPWVRQTACLFELLAPLAFERGRLWLLPRVGQGGRLSGPARPMITIERPTDAALQAQLALVLARTDERGDRLAEIVSQADGFWPFVTAVTGLDARVAPRTFELLALGAELGTCVIMRIKHEVACPRPGDLSAAVQPVLATPGHASLPSGHATTAYFVAALLRHLLPGDAAAPVHVQLRRLAWRIADNRVVAGFHFPMDGVAGRLLGELLAAYLVAACTGVSGELLGAEFAAVSRTLGSVVQLPDDDRPDYSHAFRKVVTRPRAGRPGPALPLASVAWQGARAELAALQFV